MKSAVKAALITVSVIALLALTGCSLYRLVVTSQIKDGGRMENPDAYSAGKDLVEFEWRQNHRNFYRSFSLKFYQENDMPLLIGWFPSQSGGDEIRESQMDAFSNPIPWQLTWVQWFELQNVLAESELPEYRKPSDESYDETDSKIWIVWRTDDGEKTQTLSGSQAEALEALVLGIAEEAYAASKLETEQREVRETAELVGIYWEQNASSARDCFSFLLDERTLPSRAEKQMLFSYRYQDGDGKPISGRTSPSSRRRRRRASAASDKSFVRWIFQSTIPAQARMARRIAASARHGKTAARFSQTTTAVRAHRASLPSW